MTVGNHISGTWAVYHDVYVSEYSATLYKVQVDFGIYFVAKHEHTLGYDTYVGNYSGQAEDRRKTWHGSVTKSKGSYYYLGSSLFYLDRYTYDWTASVRSSLAHTGSGAKWKGESTVLTTFTVAKRPSYAVRYYANKPGGATGDINGMPPVQYHYYGYPVTLSSIRPTYSPNYTFVKWYSNNIGIGGTSYNPSQTVSANYDLNLYAIWSYDDPPTISNIGDWEVLDKRNSGGRAINGFSRLKISFSGAKANRSGRTLSSATLTFRGNSYSATLNNGSGTFTVPTSGLAVGTYTGTIRITDSAGEYLEYPTKSVTIDAPTWTRNVTFSSKPPSRASNGSPLLVKLEVKNYSTTPASWDTVTTTAPLIIDTENNTWGFQYTFDSAHVDDPTDENPDSSVRVTYIHYDADEKDYKVAFFLTSRNQNYSNGIYNVVFVSGISASDAPNFTSRVWWCYINDPLYFPDTNYVEVGSNDTSVQGLTKVGDYMAVIKQSKTTDTAIYLLYPTSFEEETTYAVKQGVQGIGALARYSFNILGDETLFLSPNGVMAIVPTQDEEHKTQNRSYFIDGKLLKEDSLADSYSFVYDGKYWLAINNHCYVLDGNQRNSWGNDRTNLVYECYYLDNVPATCFAKYSDNLVFSTDNEVCKFKSEQDANVYVDAFDPNSSIIDIFTSVDVSQADYETEPTLYWYFDEVDGEYKQCEAGDPYDSDIQYFTYSKDYEIKNVPVKAEWSTIFDDDNSLHYYKTMQKKGNLVSILPTDYKFVIAEVDEETFNENKTNYYIHNGTDYIRCTELSVYDPLTTYYERARSATKIFVKKDEKEPIEIERSFSYSSDIPSEMYLNKKFKKYKRLQFIIKNEEAEPFGIDEIVKNYTIGNYCKR